MAREQKTRKVDVEFGAFIPDDPFANDPVIGDEALGLGKEGITGTADVAIERAGGQAEFGEGALAGFAETVVDVGTGFITGAIDALAYIPDAALNKITEKLAEENIIKGEDVGFWATKDRLSRLLTSGNYEQRRKVGNVILGMGEFVGQSGALGQIAETAGQFATFAIPQTAAVRLIGNALYGGTQASKAALRTSTLKAIKEAKQSALNKATTAAEKRKITKKFADKQTNFNEELKKFKWDKDKKVYVGPEGKIIKDKTLAKAEVTGKVAEELGEKAALGRLKSYGAREVQRAAKDPSKYLRREAKVGAGVGAAYEGLEQISPGLGDTLIIGAGAAIGGKFLFDGIKDIAKRTPSGRIINWADDALTPAVGDDPVTIGSRIKSGYTNVRDRIIKPKEEDLKEARGTVQKFISQEVSEAEARRNLETYKKIDEKLAELGIEPLELTIAEKSLSPRLLDAQASRTRTYTGQEATEQFARFARNQEKIARVEKELGLESGTNVFAFSDKDARGKLDILVKNLQGEVDKVSITSLKELDEIKNIMEGKQISPKILEEAGEQLRGILLTAKQNTEKRLLDDYNFNPNKEPSLKASEIKKAQENFLRYVYKKDKDASISDLISKYTREDDFIKKSEDLKRFVKAAPRNITLPEWITMRQQFKRALNRAFEMKATKNELDELKKVLEIFDETAKRFGTDKKAVSAQRYQQFLKQWDDEITTVYNDAAVQKVLKQRPVSREDKILYKTPEEKAGEVFLQNADTAKEFNRFVDNAVGEEKIELLSLMKDVVLGKTLGKNIWNANTGKIDVNKLRAFINNNENMLKTIKIGDEAGESTGFQLLSDQAKFYDDLVARQQKVQQMASKINQDILVNQVAKLDPKTFDVQTGILGARGVDASADAIIDSAINSAIVTGETGKPNFKLVRALLKKVKELDPKGDNGIKEEFNKIVLNKVAGKEGFANPVEFDKIINRNRPVLKEVLGEKHLEDIIVLNGIHARLQQAATALPKGRQATSADDFIKELARLTGVTPQGFSARSIAVIENRSGLRTSGVWLIGQAIRARQQRAIDQALEKALFDKDFAATMTKEMPENVPIGAIDEPTASDWRTKAFFAGIYDPSIVTDKKYRREVARTPYVGQPDTDEPEGFANPPRTQKVEIPKGMLPSNALLDVTPGATSTYNIGIAQQPVNPPRGNVQVNKYEALFPNDPLGKALAESRNKGIGSLR